MRSNSSLTPSWGSNFYLYLDKNKEGEGLLRKGGAVTVTGRQPKTHANPTAKGGQAVTGGGDCGALALGSEGWTNAERSEGRRGVV